MGADIGWFVVVVCGGVAVLLAERVARRLGPARSGSRVDRSALAGSAGILLCLVALCILLRLHAFARLDGRLLAELAPPRSSGLVALFAIITTLGDVVPCLIIATGLAMTFFLRTGEVLRPLILPAVVLTEIGIQVVVEKVSNDLRVSDVRPILPIGGSGPIPSGSVARLFSIFLIAALVWAAHNRETSRRLSVLGCILVLVEMISRLYLGRHFVTDIVGGLLLGTLLVVAAAHLLGAFETRMADSSAGRDRSAGT